MKLEQYLLPEVKFYTKEEEIELWKRMKEGDQEASDALVLSVTPYMLRIAKNTRKLYGYRGAQTIPDIYNQLVVKLKKDVFRRWDATLGRLITFMTMPLIREARKLCICESGLVSLPYKITEENPITLSYGRIPQLGGFDSNENSLHDYRQSEFDRVDESELADKVRDYLSYLSEKERYIIRRLYFDNFTFKEVGDELGVSKQRIQQIEKKALDRLRIFFN